MAASKLNKLVPSHSIHPGVILKKELDERGIKQRDFADEIGMRPTQLNELIKGKRSFSSEVSLLIEASLNVNPLLWLNLQSQYEINLARNNKELQQKAQTVKEWSEIKKLIPYSFFKKENVIGSNKEENIKTIFKLYNVNSIDALESEVRSSTTSRFRKSSVRQVNNVNLTGWVKYVEFQAKQKKVKAFHVDKREELIKKLREAFSQNGLIETLDKILTNFGIKFIVQKKIDKVPVDGFAAWSGDNPVIAVTLRYKRLDNLAFSVFHEVAHVFLHLSNNKNRKPFIDDTEASGAPKSQEEKEADLFAEDNLIPRESWNRFMSETLVFNSEIIKEFSSQIGIHPAITLGRLKKEHNEYYRRRFSIPNEIL